MPDKELLHLATQNPFVVLTPRQLNDLELLLSGAFAPLTSFMNEADYNAVLKTLRLADSTLFPMPIVLDIPPSIAEILAVGKTLTLRDNELFSLATLKITDLWQPRLKEEALAVYQTDDPTHPGVHYLLHETKPFYVSGTLTPITPIRHPDFIDLRHTPQQIKTLFQKNHWDRVVAFQTRNPLHRAHFELTRHAMEQHDAKLLLHPAVGVTRAEDINYFVRTRCYIKLMEHYPKHSALLSLLPLAMRFAGPREALWHGIVRRNYGCSHFIVGREHASPGRAANGQPFYAVTAAQDLFAEHQKEIDIELVPFETMAYSKSKKSYVFTQQDTQEDDTLFISGTQLRTMLAQDEAVPEWFSYPEIIEELKKTYVPLYQRGFTVFFTGLSGSGKSTLAHALKTRLLELGKTQISMLDGDIVRHHLSSELGFSKEHRSINVRRIGYVASEIIKNRGIVLCAPIAPFKEDRQANQRLISQHGGYIEVYVSTPLAVCEERDVKGFYRQARENITKHFTGINDPYEPPTNPAVTIDTSNYDVMEAVDKILQVIVKQGYLKIDEA